MSPKTRHRESCMGRMFTSVRGGQCVTDPEMRKAFLMIFVRDAKRELEGRLYIGASLRNQVLELDSTGLEIEA